VSLFGAPARFDGRRPTGGRPCAKWTRLGGVAAPYVFGKLIESGSRQSVFGGYVFAAMLMFAASFVAARYAVRAERKPLEEVATPLSAAG
jgi:hypothetical protein